MPHLRLITKNYRTFSDPSWGGDRRYLFLRGFLVLRRILYMNPYDANIITATVVQYQGETLTEFKLILVGVGSYTHVVRLGISPDPSEEVLLFQAEDFSDRVVEWLHSTLDFRWCNQSLDDIDHSARRELCAGIFMRDDQAMELLRSMAEE